MSRIAALILFVTLTLEGASLLNAQTEDWPRKVLLTNDDGIEAEGLLALARAFASVAETHVVAPLQNRSASTNYISAIARRQLEVETRSLYDGVRAYGVDGYPADAVVFALRGWLADDPPDLVVSGVNDGPNLSDDWNLSGTVGAAQIAAFFGVPAIAVSGYSADQPETLDALARWVVELACSPLVRDLEPGQYLAVSAPRVPIDQIEGVVFVRRAPRPWRIELHRSEDAAADPDREIWSLSFQDREVAAPLATDVHAYRQNLIAIVPMRVDEHDYQLLAELLSSGADLPAWPPRDGRR
ncbi:MAG: 5'/3'-nucleotidase SurE [Gemmatimonadales bacterium]|jgi:5'-nucleotidase